MVTDLKLTIAGYGPKESAHGLGLSTIRDAVEAESSGEVSVDVIWNIMDLGRPNLDLFEMVGNGELFMCYFSTSYQAWQVPELNVIETPYIFRDLAHAHRCLDGALGSRLRHAVRSRTPFELLGYWDNGFRHFTNGVRAIRTPDDCKGLSMRSMNSGLHQE